MLTYTELCKSNFQGQKTWKKQMKVGAHSTKPERFSVLLPWSNWKHSAINDRNPFQYNNVSSGTLNINCMYPVNYRTSTKHDA